MNDQNVQQPNGIRFCPNCGKQLAPEKLTCLNCGFTLPCNSLPQPNVMPVSLPSDNESNLKKRKKNKKLIVLLALFAVVAAIAVTIFILFETHTICIDHEWEKADCTTPKTCKYCDETEGEALGHKWTEATCTEDSVCKRCDKKGDKAIGHTEGKWTETKEATLTSRGTEERLCEICSESLENRSTEKKKPKVMDSSFNFKDEEFIDWLEDNSSLDVGLKQSLDSDINTGYLITNLDGDVGVLMLHHAENDLKGNVRGIMIYFEEETFSMAATAYIGEKMNSSFVSEDAALYLSYDKSYSKADMTAMMIDGTALLAPTEYIEEILSASEA